MIKIYDNFFSLSEKEKIYKDILNLKYTYGEKDRSDTKPTGFVSDLSEDNYSYNIIYNKLKKNKLLTNLKVYRKYVNLFKPNENPFFHTDNEKGYTVLYYSLHNINYNLDEGGETQFYIKKTKSIKAIIPNDGRIVIFDASLIHKATSFRNFDRYTIALKFI